LKVAGHPKPLYGLSAMPTNKVESIARDIERRRLKQDNFLLKQKYDSALKQLEQVRYELDTALKVKRHKDLVKPIRPREIKSGAREATWVALASDWHVEETVDPAKVNGVNSYNLAIARHRVERYFAGVSWLANYHAEEFKLRDGLLWLGGDLITGHLREENLEDNQCSPVHAIANLHGWISDGIRYTLKMTPTEKLRVVCNSGNHGRLTHKKRHATQEANSLEWLLYHFLAGEFKDDKRVEFVLPQGAHTYAQIYDWTVRFHHGDDAKYGGGVGGIHIPIRKAIQRWQTFRHADLTCLGHFHQYTCMDDLIINGSLIGYNPYALSIGAQYEEPAQAFFLMDSKRGVTMPAKVWVKK
jgi:hypothetical protein